MGRTRMTPEARREEMVGKAMGRCRYFNGVAHRLCGADVEYSTVRDPLCLGFPYPCLADSRATTTCSARAFTTRAEAEAECDRRARDAEKGMRAFAAAQKDAGERGLGRHKPGVGECACPCGGTIRYAVASNGHMHGQCDGPCGVAWMQ